MRLHRIVLLARLGEPTLDLDGGGRKRAVGIALPRKGAAPFLLGRRGRGKSASDVETRLRRGIARILQVHEGCATTRFGLRRRDDERERLTGKVHDRILQDAQLLARHRVDGGTFFCRSVGKARGILVRQDEDDARCAFGGSAVDVDHASGADRAVHRRGVE